MEQETVKIKAREQICDAVKIAKVMQWRFEIAEDGLILLVEMRHRRKPGPQYLLRVGFDDYPQRAPSYYFVDMNTRKAGASPPNVHHGNPLPGICTPGTRECCEVYHKNQAQYAWNPSKYPLRSVLMEVQKMMEVGIGE
jgi:hypothetical protein